MKKRYFNLILTFIFGILFHFVNAQVSGTVFQDGNGDGTYQGTEPIIGGVTINAYDAAGNLCGSAVSVSNASPNYTINGCGGALRLEFIIPAPSSCGLDNTLDFSTVSGSNSKTSVQFTSDGTTGNDFGVLSNDFYVKNTNPVMFVPNYINGSGVQGTSSDGDALYSFLYNSSGVPTSQGGSAPDPTILAKGHQVGSVWGTAYSKQAGRIFVAAFLKRHVGMGPDGSGAIYMIDPNNPPPAGTVPSFIDLDALGFPTSGSGAYVATHPGFSDVIGTNAERGLPDNKTLPSEDRSAFDQVGKVSLGDIDISEDGRYLYVVNLYDRKLYQIDLQDAASPVVPTAAQVKSYDMAPWLSLSCSNGVSRPFATKYYRGSVYVGVVCTGENANYPGNLDRYADDLRAYVYKVDPTSNGSSATIKIEFPLNYEKENVGTGDLSPVYGWYNWTDDWADIHSPTYASPDFFSHPQPILADIEVDNDGSLILSLMDRGGHQGGIYNLAPDGSGDIRSYVVGGDILKTYKNPNTCEFELEANGVVGPYTSNSADPILNGGAWANTGPSSPNGVGAAFTGYYQSGTSGALVGNTQSGAGKEFYFGDYANIEGHDYPFPHHNEGVVGGLALYPTSGEVMVVGMDPVDNEYFSGGVYSLDNTVGARNNGYNLYTKAADRTSGHFGKAAGLGDVEIVSEIPPLEIGNRVWLDTDADGVQDPGEQGISGVSVELYQGATLIATATTDANGNYIFSNDPNGTSTASHIYNITQLEPNTAYTIKVPTTNGGNSLTTKDSGEGSNTDLNDSDADTGTGEVAIQASDIPVTGANNHSYDIGYAPASCTLTSAGKTNETCNDNGTGSNSGDDYITFDLNPTGTDLGTGYTVSVDNGGTISPSSGSYGSATSFQLQGGSANGTTYTITITDNADANCTITTMVMQNSCSNACSLTDAGKTNEQCNNNNTSGDPADDYITVDLNPTGANLGTGYTVSVSGASISPTSANYGSSTSFQLNTGSAGGLSYNITITDNADPNCKITTTVQQNSCSTCSTSATFTTDCDDNGTLPNENDDYFNLSVTGTVTDGTGNYVVKIGAYTSASTPSGTVVNVTGDGQGGNPMLAADGASTYTVRIEDASDSSCFTEYTVGPVNECSECPTPDCLNVQMKKNN